MKFLRYSDEKKFLSFQIPGMLLLVLLIRRKEKEFPRYHEDDKLICRSGFWRDCFEDD